MYVHAHMPQPMCGGQRSYLWNQFSPSFTWDPGMELRQPGFTTTTLRRQRCHQSPAVSLSFLFRHLPRAEACVCSSGWPFLGECCSEPANRDIAPAERRPSMLGQKHPATTYTLAWSPALVLVFAQSYQTMFVFLVFKTEGKKERERKKK